MGERLPHGRGLPPKPHLFGAKRRIALQFSAHVRQVPVRLLVDVVDHMSGPAIHLVGLVHHVLAENEGVPAEQLGLPVVGIPAAVGDPAPHEAVPARHEVGVGGIGLANDPPHLLAGLVRAALVRVQAENPFVTRTGDCRGTQLAEPFEGRLHDPGPELGGDCRTPVRTVGVDQHDLVGPKYALHRCRDVRLVVVGDDVGGNLRFRHRHPYRAAAGYGFFARKMKLLQ